jgi:hypothetical protein
MKLRSTFVLLMILGITGLAAIPASGAPVPAKILKVDAQAPKVLETLHDLSLRLYGQMDRFYLVEDSPEAKSLLSAQGLVFTDLFLSPDLPLYLVYLPRQGVLDKVSSLAAVLFVDGRMALVQMDEKTALRVSRLGGELVKLPEKAYPVYLPSGRGYPRPALLDTFVQRLVNKVNQDSIRAQIQRLQDFRSRYSYSDSCRSAEQYVFNYFTAIGLDSVALDPYQYQGNTWRNVIGTRLGRVNPRKVVIVCGHLDAITYEGPDTLAPGAEDNASGTVMALEAARILTGENLDLSVKFIAFTGEEQGLIGSQHYAQLMRSQNVDILGVLNFDMIAWPGGAFGVSIYCNQASLPLAQFEDQIAGSYTSLAHRVTIGSYGSDQLSFHAQGYEGTAGAEYGNFYPYYHTTGDTIGYLSMSLAAEVAKMGVASLAVLAASPASPDDFVLRDAGSGGALDAAWLPSLHPDLAGYKLFWGTASRTYTDSLILGRAISRRISGLQNGTRYYATISAFDSAGHEGGPAPERSAVPGIVPAAPSGLAALPFYFGMRLTWQRNIERDMAGYNLYRSTTSGGNYIKLNTVVLPDTAYRDSSLLSDTMYYYVVTAVDTSQNESPYSSEVRGKPISLDHGILLVDETRDGTGQQGSPSDAQQDAFYHYILQGTRYTDWDVAQVGIPLAGDVGPYSTIVWHADDYTEFRVSPALPGLANYLSRGGRFWMVGWKPVLGLMLVGSYPYTFASGQFPYDYLHLSQSLESALRDFVGAAGQLGYPSVSVDSMKANPVLHGKLPYIDTAIPRDAETLLTFNSASGDTFQGKSVGVRWLNGPYRIVFFGFPFYFMKDSEARQVAVKVLQDLGEPIGVEAEGSLPSFTTALYPLHPNPFRETSRIEYALAEKGRVRLSVYNVAGQLVKELVDMVQPPGRYSASWDGRDQGSHPLPSGVYLYRLEVSDKSWIRKAVLLR